jgi:hypothetical protein
LKAAARKAVAVAAKPAREEATVAVRGAREEAAAKGWAVVASSSEIFL